MLYSAVQHIIQVLFEFPNTDGTAGQVLQTDGYANLSFASPSGGANTPAFEATIGSQTNITDNAITKVAFDTEQFDTDSCYDATTNYRFTPTVSGKYFIYATVNGGSDTNNDINDLRCYLYKNGSSVTLNDNAPNGNFRRMGLNVYANLDMNGSTDYVEIYFQSNIVSGTARYEVGGRFGAYRIGD